MSSNHLENDPVLLQKAELLESSFADLRNYIKQIVDTKLDRRVRGRIDPSDIVQETYIKAFRRYGEYVESPKISIQDWIRTLALQTVQAAHRVHLDAVKRTVGRELNGTGGTSNEPLPTIEMERVPSSGATPHSAAVRAELQQTVCDLVESLSEADREVLRLRHQETLSNMECAQRLGISEEAASKRYIRALRRLRVVADSHLE